MRLCPLHPGRLGESGCRQPVVLAGPSAESPAPGRNRAPGEGVPSRLHQPWAGPVPRWLARLPNRKASIGSPSRSSSVRDEWPENFGPGRPRFHVPLKMPRSQSMTRSLHARSLVLDVAGERLAIVAVDLATYTSEHLVAVCKERLLFESRTSYSALPIPIPTRAAAMRRSTKSGSFRPEPRSTTCSRQGSPPGTGFPARVQPPGQSATTGTPANHGSGMSITRPRIPNGSLGLVNPEVGLSKSKT